MADKKEDKKENVLISDLVHREGDKEKLERWQEYKNKIESGNVEETFKQEKQHRHIEENINPHGVPMLIGEFKDGSHDGTTDIFVFGNDSNYSAFEQNGFMEANGDATAWKDINMGAAMLSKPASSAPGADEFVDEGGNDTGVETYAFDIGEKVSGSFEIQHDYKEGSDIYFHIHWQGIAAPAGGTDNVKWQIIYTVARDAATLDAVTTITKESAITTQYSFVFSDFAAVTGTNFKIGDQILFQVSRIAASADDYAGDALIGTLGIHYQVNTLGSRAIITK